MIAECHGLLELGGAQPWGPGSPQVLRALLSGSVVGPAVIAANKMGVAFSCGAYILFFFKILFTYF